MSRCINRMYRGLFTAGIICCLLGMGNSVRSQDKSTNASWIRPADEKSPGIWGIRNGIVAGIWPAAIEPGKKGSDGGPRGLLRIGYEFMGMIYHINYIAIEPVVKGKMEFSEISPSEVDGKWGKFMWAGDTVRTGHFTPAAGTRGVLQELDDPTDETLSWYVFMEKFSNGAHPYLRLSIRRSRPEELVIEVFHHADSAPMERCGITATMGNYGRLRQLYLKDKVIDARELYAGYQDIDFIEKAPYPAEVLARTRQGGFVAMATAGETFAELASWPQEPAYLARWNWRYRPFYMLTQYWRKDDAGRQASLQVRVNGRAKYWSGGSRNAADYINIPGGPSFENFELRESYAPGQKVYFGLSRKTPAQLLTDL